MLKDKCVVFGAGKNTRKYIASIEDRFDIIAVADNNSSLWGKSINDYEVISPTDIVNSDCDCVVISVRRYHEVQRQLTDLGITNIIVLADGLLYKYGTDNLMEPLHFKDIPVPYKKGTEGMHVLFVQKRPLTRVFKISEMLCNLGISVSLAYVEDTPDEMRGYLRFYKNIVRVVSFDELIDYINKSDYDIVHCVNEPDEFTCVLCGINKPLVHDCSDFVSLRDEPNITKISLEYIANTKCDGYVYASENCRKLAMQRYGAREGNSIAIENRPSISAIPTCEMSKLSAKDNELHCVYEGGISSAPSYFRFFEDQWLRLAEAGIHIHFYTMFDEEYCRRLADRNKRIHYEGNASIDKLLIQMTQYDCGWCVFNEFPAYKLKLDTTSSNKIFEYLAAGLPIAVSNHSFHTDIIKKYDVGKVIEWDKDIKKQIEEITRKKVGIDFITAKSLTMECQGESLKEFYRKIIAQKALIQ